jgi:L-ascorbate metabolism protein UlaG (beta-lactamase superfamily)
VDIQFYGANCLSLTTKGNRLVIDDNLVKLGAKSITKPDDIALFTNEIQDLKYRLSFSSPGEYEVADISIIGIAARSHMDEQKTNQATMFKLILGDQSILITGHIYPDLSESKLEQIGVVDVLIVPVGGNGYTVDPVGALKLIKAIEPKIVIPTHYADKDLTYPVPQLDLSNALKEMAMEPMETLPKMKLKPIEFSDVTQLVILEKA